jgi:hypothetical protein
MPEPFRRWLVVFPAREQDIVPQLAGGGKSYARGWNVRPEFSVVHQMPNVDAVQRHHCIGDEPAVTAPPNSFRTHDCSSRVDNARQEFVQGKCELVGFHVVSVRAKSRMTQRDVTAVGVASAEPAESGLPNICATAELREPSLHLFSPELGMASLSHGAATVDELAGLIRDAEIESGWPPPFRSDESIFDATQYFVRPGPVAGLSCPNLTSHGMRRGHVEVREP